MKHKTLQVENSHQRLKQDLRKRILEVEQKVAMGNRANLLGSTPTSEKREKISSAEAGTRLRSVNNMIGGIISQGQNTREKLLDSSYVLRSTKGELASGSDHLMNSKRLLEKLKRRRRTDQLLFVLCLAFFFATCLLILFKRFTPGFILRRVKTLMFSNDEKNEL